MGSYLDKPETTTKSSLEENELLLVGSSSMQGWRINQEDAHNAILDFSENAAFFAVFDGHGGAEVAEYCSMKLPDFLKQLQSFKDGNYSVALVEAFLGFDAALMDGKVLEELKQLARKNPPDTDEYDDEEDDNEEVYNLQMEATMSLKEVLENYKRNSQNKDTHQAKTDIAGPSKSLSWIQNSSAVENIGDRLAENEVSSSSKHLSVTDSSDSPSSSCGGSTSKISPDSTQKIVIPDNTLEEEKCVEKKNKNDGDNIITSSSSQENGENIVDSPSSSSSLRKPTITQNVACAGESSGSCGGTMTNNEKTSLAVTNEKASASSSDTDSDIALDSDESTDVDDLEDMGDEDNEDSDEEENEDEESSEWAEEEEEELLNNEFMQNMESGPGKASGCTAVVALIVGREVIVANAGDSRCIICRNGKSVEMSFDHKPEDEIEFERIRKAGGRVSLDGRVNGGLNLSRAIGDHGYKMNKNLLPEEQMISAVPDLKHHTLMPGDEFMVLACDGIWNYMSNEEVVGFVKQRIDAGKKTLSEICDELFHNCLAPNTMGDGTGCDNMTAIIIKFKPEIFSLKMSPMICSNEKAQTIQNKRGCPDESSESEANAAPKKKGKLDDDLATTPAAVDTSTS